MGNQTHAYRQVMLALSLLLLVLPWSAAPIPVNAVDLVEINHYSPEDGARFRQVIWWEWSSTTGQYRVVAWCFDANVFPHQTHFDTLWFDRSGRPRHMRAAQAIETWSWYDPELADRARWPEHKRRRLR